MPSSRILRLQSRNALNNLKRRQAKTYATQETTRVAAPAGNGLVSIRGQLYPGATIDTATEVVNVGRPASAIYAVKRGGGVTSSNVVVGSGSAGAASGGNADTLDGLDSSAFALTGHTHPTPTGSDWTPTIAGDSTAGTNTYTQQKGRYIKDGANVVAWFNIVINAYDAATAGNIEIRGLPFATVNINNVFFGVDINMFDALASGVVFLGGFAINNVTAIRLYKLAAAGTGMVRLVAADLQNGSRLTGKLVYEAA